MNYKIIKLWDWEQIEIDFKKEVKYYTVGRSFNGNDFWVELDRYREASENISEQIRTYETTVENGQDRGQAGHINDDQQSTDTENNGDGSPSGAIIGRKWSIEELTSFSRWAEGRRSGLYNCWNSAEYRNSQRYCI